MLIYIYVGDGMVQVSFRVDDDIKKKAERTFKEYLLTGNSLRYRDL